MKKKLLYLGLMLVAVGVGIGLIAPGTVIPSLFPAPSMQSATVAQGAMSSLPIQINESDESGLPIIRFSSSSGVDFYLANASAYAAISGAGGGNSSARSTAVGLEGRGVYEIYENATSGAFPFLSYLNVTAPAYILNSSLLQPGTYYMIFRNQGSSTANIAVKAFTVSLSKVESGEASVGAYLTVAAVVFFAGVGLAIYALIAKDREKAQVAIDEDVAREYERIEKQGRKKRSKKR
jgi:hypothetical protein